MYRIETTPSFDKAIKKIDVALSNRIIEKIEKLAKTPELLKNRLRYVPKDLGGLQKYRIGDYRIFFWLDHSQKKIILYWVGHRKEAYKNLFR